MRAVVIQSGTLEINEVPDPVPEEGELLVRVEAAGINGADLLQRAGRYPPPPGKTPDDIPGLECAGTVALVGPGESRHKVGDRVMGIVPGAGQAELCLMADSLAIPVPEGLAWPEAGGFAEVFATAHDALFSQCHLAPSERLLVTGAAGGVGLASVQLGHHRGAHVVASARREELRKRVAELGADETIDPSEEEEHGPYDVIIELVGAGSLLSHVSSLSTGGRIVFIGVGGSGPRTEFDARELMSKRGVVRGSTLRARTLAERSEVTRRLIEDALAPLASGEITVPIAATYPLSDVRRAYDHFETGGKFGKIVLTMREQ